MLDRSAGYRLSRVGRLGVEETRLLLRWTHADFADQVLRDVCVRRLVSLRQVHHLIFRISIQSDRRAPNPCEFVVRDHWVHIVPTQEQGIPVTALEQTPVDLQTLRVLCKDGPEDLQAPVTTRWHDVVLQVRRSRTDELESAECDVLGSLRLGIPFDVEERVESRGGEHIRGGRRLALSVVGEVVEIPAVLRLARREIQKELIRIVEQSKCIVNPVLGSIVGSAGALESTNGPIHPAILEIGAVDDEVPSRPV